MPQEERINDLLDVNEVTAVVDSVLDDIVWTVQLSYVLSGLCGLVIIYHFGKIAVENLVRGGEPFVFSKLSTPFFYMLMLASWTWLHGFIEFGVEVFENEVFTNANILYDQNADIYSELDGGIETINKRIEQKENYDRMKNDSYFSVPGMSEIGYWFSTIDDRIILQMTAWAFDLISQLDYCLYVVFYVVSKLWFKIIAFGAPIAFAASILMGGWSVLMNWIKNYLSVALWLPIAGLLLQLLNRILLQVLGVMSTGISTRITGLTSTSLEFVSPTALISGMLGLVVQLLVVIVVFFALKILVLAKVPSIVSTMVQAGQGLAGGFAMAFVPVNVAKSTASTAAIVAGSAATGGAFAGAAGAAAAAKQGSGLKKQ